MEADDVLEVMSGLSQSQKTISPKFLYDEKGSLLFEKICMLPEYYPTRAEVEILKNHAAEIVKLIGDQVVLIEPGSGNSSKVRFLLDEFEREITYVPIEISEEILLKACHHLKEDYPQMEIIPLCADFTKTNWILPDFKEKDGKRIIFFPGSTLGNFHPTQAIRMMQTFADMAGDKGGLLIGLDLKKDRESLERAYDDSQGVTASFNLNVLERFNREMHGTFRLNQFQHEAFYNENLGRVEMHLKSKVSQFVKLHDDYVFFRKDETIHTENSYKYSVEDYVALSIEASLEVKKIWKDPAERFCLYYLERQIHN